MVRFSTLKSSLGRRVAEKLNGIVTKRWLWCGSELCEERDASGATVTKRFFAQGEQVGSTNYYFTFDHLGSVREMTDASGNVKARYDYDPYGRRTKVSGTVDADFGFTGHYYHSASGLYLTLYRAYDAKTGRWLSRDPSGESAGMNLYSYVHNNPTRFSDALGLCESNETFGSVNDFLGKANDIREDFAKQIEELGTLEYTSEKLFYYEDQFQKVFAYQYSSTTISFEKIGKTLGKYAKPLSILSALGDLGEAVYKDRANASKYHGIRIGRGSHYRVG